MTETLAVLAASWGVLMAISPVLQIRRMVVRRSSSDLSLSYLFVLIPGFVLWICYGLALGNPAIVAPNSVALTTAVLTVLVALRYRSAPA